MKFITSVHYLKYAYIIGGIYDLLLGIALLFFNNLFISLFSIERPVPIIFAQTTALFLIATGYFLLYSSQDPAHFIFVGLGSIFVRFSYSLIVLESWVIGSVEPIYLLFAFTDSLTGIIIAVPLFLTKNINKKTFLTLT